MRILVCLKVVPDLEQGIVLTGQPGEVQGQEIKVNSYDLQALELALRLRERHPEVQIDLVSVGGQDVLWGLRRGLGVGADQAFWICSHLPALGHSREVALMLGRFLEGQGYDLVMCGMISEDNMQGVVPGALAGCLHWSWISFVTDLEVDGPGIRVLREEEDGRAKEVYSPLPAVVGVQSGLVRPRYPKLSLLLKAKQAEIKKIDLECPFRSVSFDLEYARSVRKGIKVSGDRQANLTALLDFLRSKGFIKE